MSSPTIPTYRHTTIFYEMRFPNPNEEWVRNYNQEKEANNSWISQNNKEMARFLLEVVSDEMAGGYMERKIT